MNSIHDLSDFELNRSLNQLLPEEFCRENDAVLLKKEDTLYLGMLNLYNREALRKAANITGRPIQSAVQLNDYELDRAMEWIFSEDDASAVLEHPGENYIRERLFLQYEDKIHFEREQPAAGIVSDTIAAAIRDRATDIHIEIYSREVDLRFRIDNILHRRKTPITPHNVSAVINRIKVLAELDVAVHHHPQSGHIVTFYVDRHSRGRRIDVRVSLLPGLYGEDAVLRILDEEQMNIDINNLGMNDEQSVLFSELIHRPSGLIMVTGPTAGGKTTTLYSAISHLTTDNNKIVTVEDPIEFEIPRVNQKQISSNLTFSEYTKNFMRQNPDIIMVGEIRDEETARVAFRAAQVGHLVLTTLHTQDAVSAISRMLSFGIDVNILISLLRASLSQRLVRKICPDCRKKTRPSRYITETFPPLPESMTFYTGTGCSTCNQTGYLGLTGVFEIICFSEELKQYILKTHRISKEELHKTFQYNTMYDHALEKINQGITTAEEVLRVIPIPIHFFNPTDK